MGLNLSPCGGNVTCCRGAQQCHSALRLLLCPSPSFFLMQIHTEKKILCQFFESPIIPSTAAPYLTLASFHFSCQVNLRPSVGATCRSGTSPRETVGLTTWKSASAGAAACPGLMSPWRYAAERAAHSNDSISTCNECEWLVVAGKGQ